jgi:hypothetical protein
MKKRLSNWSVKALYSLATAALVFAFSVQGFSQTAADTNIKNVASATYSDGTNNYNAVSNEVTVTVAKVAGLTITPDGQSDPTVVPGQTSITKTFTVTNVGNFTDQVKFLANGGSFTVTGPGTVTAATVNGVDILTNSANVLQSLAQNGTATVVITYTVNATASAGDVVQVFLGDTATGTNFDNVATDTSAHNVSTVSTGAVNGSREARGDISATVSKDALPQVNLTAPSGPVALGSTVTYSAEVCNVGARDLLPISPDTQVFVYAPIPAGTVFNDTTMPVGTEYTTSPLTTAPLSATWSTTPPAVLANVTRVRIPVGTSVAAGTCATPVTFDVSITTTNATLPIYEIVEVFGSNSIGATLTDQSGDAVPAKGDGNANFDEPLTGGSATVNQGFQSPTTLAQTGGVFNGPDGSPQASGPSSVNDDFSNRSVNTGINVAPGGITTAAGTTVFTNTLENTGNADDTYTLSAPTVPTGFTVEVSTDGGTTWVTVSGGGSTTVDVPFGTSVDYLVRVTAPIGKDVLTGYDTVIRATSEIDPTKFNDTIDRLYTGFIKLEKTAVVANGTGVGGATDPVPGAVITYTIKYTNISEASTASGSVGLTANNLVILEDGDALPNNWLANTDRVAASEFDYVGATGTTAGSGVINAYVADASRVTDTVATVNPQYVGRLVFKRTIK